MYIVCFCVKMCTCDGGALTDQKKTSHFLQVESQVVWAVQRGAVSPGPVKEQYALLTSELSLLHPDLKGKGNQEGVWWVTGSRLARQPSREFLTFVTIYQQKRKREEGERKRGPTGEQEFALCLGNH